MLEEEEVLQHSGSILGSVILCGTSRRISQLWDNAYTLNLENCLLYFSSTISPFCDFIRCIAFDFIFYCVTVHTLYWKKEWEVEYVALLTAMVKQIISKWKIIMKINHQSTSHILMLNICGNGEWVTVSHRNSA